MQARLYEQGTIVTNKCLADNHCYITVKAPKIAAVTLPGQFVFIRCTDSTVPYLRRPISICSVDVENGTIGLLMKVIGQGTKIISNYSVEDTIDLMGPIGTPFPVIEGCSPIIVAGGIGIAPLMLLIEKYAETGLKPSLIYGTSTKGQLFFLDELKGKAEIKIVTEDGSAGEAGITTDYIEEELEAKRYTHIYACGPKGMLAGVQKIAGSYHIPGFVSLEERLACGIGACSGCAFPMKTPEGKKTYKKVCVDGPVFTLEEVIFND